MKKWIGWSGAAILVLGIGATGLVTLFNPGVRFNQRKLPVVAVALARPQTAERYARRAGFNILILGLDTWVRSAGRADLIMVININPQTRQVNVVSIPRDTKVPAGNLGWTKINHLHLLSENRKKPVGTQAMIDAVCDLMQRNLNYYIKINFRSFEDFIDQLGGLDITLERPVKLTFKNQVLPAGANHLDGATALELTRERFSLRAGDFSRQAQQLRVLKALVRQLVRADNLPKLPRQIQAAQKYLVATNLSPADWLAIAGLLHGLPESNLQYHQVPGRPQTGLDPLTHTQVDYWAPDRESLKRLGKDYF